jgi:hypothetical protein
MFNINGGWDHAKELMTDRMPEYNARKNVGMIFQGWDHSK